jgi:hypothetical protein
MISAKHQAKLSARLHACREITDTVTALATANLGMDRAELTALAARLKLCGQPRNTFVATNAINFTTGEEYTASGNLWHCGSKMCPNCIARFSATNRRKLQRAIERVKLRKGEKWYFPTFTILNFGRSLVETRHIVNQVWSRFRKRSLCVSSIRGGCKSEEFTLTKNGYHYHLHCLFISKYLHYQEVRRVWTECFTNYCDENNINYNIDTADGLLIVRFEPITKLENLPFELCKYITKSDSWSKMRQTDLTEVCLVQRWWRMFELFGAMAPREEQTDQTEPSDESPKSIVHTRSLTDGVSSSHSEFWRTRLLKISLAEYLAELEMQFAETIAFRREQLQRRWPETRIFTGEELH